MLIDQILVSSITYKKLCFCILNILKKGERKVKDLLCLLLESRSPLAEINSKKWISDMYIFFKKYESAQSRSQCPYHLKVQPTISVSTHPLRVEAIGTSHRQNCGMLICVLIVF